MKPILVAYATTYGSTRDVAEKVAEILEDLGVETKIRPAADVITLHEYSAVILGGALYYFRWHKHARKFLSRHRKALRALPIAVFAIGPFNDTEEDFVSARRHLDRSLNRHAWLKPRAVGIFGGRFDPMGLKFPHNNPAVKRIPASDIRDWDAIRAWAESLPAALGVKTT